MKKLATIIVAMICAAGVFAQSEGVTCGPRFKPADQQMLDKAVSQLKNHRYKECREMLHKLSAKYPSAPDPYFYLGLASVGKDYNAAGIRKYFTKVASLCPDYPNALAHYYLAIVYYTDEKFDEAVAELKRYFEIYDANRTTEYEAVYEEASNYLYWSTFLAEAYQNKAPFDPKPMLGVSSKENEWLPYLSPDGKTMYYLREVAEDRSAGFYKKEMVEKFLRLYSSTLRDSTFTEGAEMPMPFNTTSNEGNVTLTADGCTMYYAMMKLKNGYANCDIFTTTKKNGRWSPLTNAGTNVNGEKSWESQPSVTADGQYLYFASNRQGGMGGTDIWRCHRLPNGDWSRAENLGPSVNTAGNEKCPFIHADGKTLYFASDGWQGFGGYDMYFININDTYLQRPTNMGLPINSENDEICFGVTSDGSKGYYADKPSEGVDGIGGSDIFFFDLYPAARPEPMVLSKGQVSSDSGKPVGAKVQLYRAGTNRSDYEADSLSGNVHLMLSMKEDNLLVAQAEGFMPGVKVIKASTVKRSREESVGTVTLRPLKKGGKYTVPGIQVTSEGLNRESRMMIDAYIAFLREHPMVHVRIEGLTERTVKAVYDYMLAQKMRKERLAFKVGDTMELTFVVTQK